MGISKNVYSTEKILNGKRSVDLSVNLNYHIKKKSKGDLNIMYKCFMVTV